MCLEVQETDLAGFRSAPARHFPQRVLRPLPKVLALATLDAEEGVQKRVQSLQALEYGDKVDVYPPAARRDGETRKTRIFRTLDHPWGAMEYLEYGQF